MELKRLYGNGTVGMVVVLDHVSGLSAPFSDYTQPAFFTIVEAPESNKTSHHAHYVLQDTAGNEVSTEGHSTACYLSKVDDWAAWKKQKTAEVANDNARIIATLGDRVSLLKGIMVEQGVRVISNDQAQKLGIKP
jgi:hypothetical protein